MITTDTRKVYVANERGRAFLTLDAACMSEARALIFKKYPTVNGDSDEFGRCTDPGYFFPEDNPYGWEYYERLQRRLANFIKRRFKEKK